MKLTAEQSARVEELLAKMTLEEKIGQMNQEAVSIVGGFDVPFEELIEMMTDGRLPMEEFEKIMSTATQDFHEDDIRAGRVGSLMVQDPRKCNELQKIAVEETRLGIPLMFGLDVIHGFRTVYPIAIAEAGAFDRDLFKKTAAMAAKESRTQGVNWHFAPMLDVARDSRWGRVSEGPGEDPYLMSEFAKAKIEGLQDDQSSPENYVAACLKHYVAYGAVESGRDYNTSMMSDSMLRNVYLKPFEAAVKAGAATVMSSFNDLNGMPCTVNEYTLRDILKKEWGFNGFVVSDANAIRECVNHGIATDYVDAGIQAAKAGLDVDMGTSIYKDHLGKAVADGLIDEEYITEAARRIISVKMWLGLFDHPYTDEAIMDKYEVLPEEHLAIAREAAAKSMVLLKNDNNVLPLKKSQKVALVGELAANREEVVGAWSLSWRPEDCVSVKQGFENAGVTFDYFPCCGVETEINEDEIAKAAEYGDVIVAVVGETIAMSGEASSKADTTLPGNQREFIAKLIETGKPVVVCLQNGRPLALKWEAEHCDTLVECWHLGIQAGNAIADVLYGKRNFEGRLASTIPQVTGQCPIYYNHPNTGRPGGKSKFTSKYIDVSHEPMFAFGEGLSYSQFLYSELNVEDKGDELLVSVAVMNRGDYAGTETVQLYIQDVTASIVRPVKELKNFAKVGINPGEEKKVKMVLKKEDMGFYNNDKQYLKEDGLFRIYVGHSSVDCLMAEVDVRF